MLSLAVALTAVVLLSCSSGSPDTLHRVPYVLISEVSPHDPEFIELYNPTEERVDLGGFWFCYYPSDRTSWDESWRQRQFLDGASIEPGGYYLVSLGDPVPGRVDWQAYSGKMIKADAGTIAILDGPPGQGDVIDAVGWGDCDLFLVAPAQSAPAGLALAREPGASCEEPFGYEANNAADFTHAPPGPSCAALGATIAAVTSREDGSTGILSNLIVCNAGATRETFSLVLGSEIGLRVIPEPSEVTLNSGESARFQLVPATYEFYAIDLETSGFSAASDEIIEVAWAHFRCGELVQTYSSLVQPRRQLDPSITELTGITNEMLKVAPNMADVIPSVLQRLKGQSVLCYSQNRFDQRFLEAAAASLQLEAPDIRWINVLPWAGRLLPELEDHGLEAVCNALAVEGQHHRALSDALMTGQVFLKALRELGTTMTVTVLPKGKTLPVAALAMSIDVAFLDCD